MQFLLPKIIRNAYVTDSECGLLTIFSWDGCILKLFSNDFLAQFSQIWCVPQVMNIMYNSKG
jgi:hypothetical protein